MDSLLTVAEYFNAETMQVEYDLHRNGQECGPGGELVQVDTPWAMGLVDEQTEAIQAPHDLAEYPYYDEGPDGPDDEAGTPWAMGFVDKHRGCH